MRFPVAWLCGCVVLVLADRVASATSVAAGPGRYALTVETVMPHLEENLRYATTRENRCLDGDEADTLFPLLRHQSFAGCSLEDGVMHGDQRHYSLRCQNPAAATGTARLTITPVALRGVLDIRMGGKNMTLSQRVAGIRLGDCPADR